LLFGTLLSWCAALLLLRFERSGSVAMGFLAWNLFLAAIPAVAAWFFARAMANGSSLIQQIVWFAVWLVFLPNAPYIITDFVHLKAPGFSWATLRSQTCRPRSPGDSPQLWAGCS